MKTKRNPIKITIYANGVEEAKKILDRLGGTDIVSVDNKIHFKG